MVNKSTESIVRNKSNVDKEKFKIIKAVDDNINIDINDKAEDVDNVVKSENDEETSWGCAVPSSGETRVS